MWSSSIFSSVLPSTLSSCDFLPFHFCLFHIPLSPFACATSTSPSSPHSWLFLVMLAPCRTCSMPSLTCLRAAVMKILRRRKILHGFILGPGTLMHSVGVCVCLLSNVSTARPSGPRRLTTNCTQTRQGIVVRKSALLSAIYQRFSHNIPEL